MVKVHFLRRANVKHNCDFHFNLSFQFINTHLKKENVYKAYLFTCAQVKCVCDVLSPSWA